MTTIIIAVLVLSILILIHEIGHYTMARIVGVHVEEFGIGLPPRIAGITIKGTIYSVNWLPIGGFVRLAGEDDEHTIVSNPTKKQKHFFWAKSRLERTAIITAGVFMNFSLAVGITSYLLSAEGIHTQTEDVFIREIAPDSPASDAGLRADDTIRIVTVNPDTEQQESIPITSADELISVTKEHLDQPIVLTYLRNTEESTASVTPRSNPPEGQGAIGVTIANRTIREKIPFPLSVGKAFEINIRQTQEMFVFLAKTIGGLVLLRAPSEGVAGPIGIVKVTGEAAKYGFHALLEFMAILSLNLAVLNILPIPALDGGRLLFIGFETVFGKKVKPSFEKTAHQYGMLVLFALLLLITFHDILRIASGAL